MDLSEQKVCVIGAGIGGLTAALALRQLGARVCVLEQAEAIKEVGAGLQVSPNGLAVLRGLGLASHLEARSVKAQAVELRDYAAGRLVAHLDLGLIKAGTPYHFVHRADLIDLLAQAVRAAGIKILLLQNVETVHPGRDSERARVVMSNGSEMRADLVIGGDGLHSRLRGVLNGTVAPFFTRQVAWRAIVPNTMRHGNLVQVHMGPHRHLVSYPLRGGTMVNLVAVQEQAGWAEEGWHHTDDPQNLRRVFNDFGGDARALLGEVTEVSRWGLFRHPVAPVWHQGNCAILGDAAHPTLPFMAQGASMAMEDAWVLRDALERAGTLSEGLAAYQTRREERVKRVVDAASKNAWKYHLANPVVRSAAHMGMRLATTFAPKKLVGQFDWIYSHDVTKP
ncbi:FAD-dependent monooxygenase [Shimia sp. MMG029]|uniref:FAD-dependent monooxygenase n=1 Tax=Shimia sp. MMG029 TaxID=3021978 RepID=UPI0022FE6B22|nr:FAD-dependent monooxygenase [Shimia sp. MMG029]MDA5556304.1 FAD-dependent monooxygenase [Shimia sp. MMG029]